MRNQEWYPTLPQLHPLHFPKLILRLLIRNAMHCETTLSIIDETEILARLLDADHVHETCWVSGIGTDFAVDFDEALHYDCFGFPGVEGVFETFKTQLLVLTPPTVRVGDSFPAIPISDEDDQGHAIPQFVRTWASFWRISTAQLVEQPVRWRCQPLLMLPRSSNHLCGVVVESAAR